MLQSEEFDKALGQAREQVQAGTDIESVLFALREKGADKIDSIKIVRTVMNLSMAQAKSMVDRSETWSDRYADDRDFHKAVRQAGEQLKTEDSGTEVVVEERSSDPEFDGIANGVESKGTRGDKGQEGDEGDKRDSLT